MQSVCNRFVMDMTDTRMGPEQKCRNCQFMKKEHNQSNSQQLPSNESSSNKVSDLKKKFSGPNNQIQEKFQVAVRSSVQMIKQEEKIPPQIQVNQTINQTDQSNIPIRKIESQLISNESSMQSEQNNKNQIYLEKQQSNKFQSDEVKQIQEPPKQQFQIETAPFQTKLSNNPFLKNDKQQQNQVPFVKPSVPNKIAGNESKQQQIIQNQFQQQSEQTKKVVSGDQENKNAFVKQQSPIVQQQSTTESQESPNKQQKIESQESPNKQQKIENVAKGKPMIIPFGFGPPPVKKISNQQESESFQEQQMIERPIIQQKKNKRTIQEFSDFN